MTSALARQTAVVLVESLPKSETDLELPDCDAWWQSKALGNKDDA